VKLYLQGTGYVPAAEENGGFKGVISCPGIIPAAKGVLKILQHSSQVLAQLVIFFNRIWARRGLIIEMIIVDGLPPSIEIDFFQFGGGGAPKEKGTLIKLPDPEKRERSRPIFGSLKLSTQFEKALLGSLQQLRYAFFERVRSSAH
jgi:hypothetical protein